MNQQLLSNVLQVAFFVIVVFFFLTSTVNYFYCLHWRFDGKVVFAALSSFMQWCLLCQQEASSCCCPTQQTFNHFAKCTFKISPPPKHFLRALYKMDVIRFRRRTSRLMMLEISQRHRFWKGSITCDYIPAVEKLFYRWAGGCEPSLALVVFQLRGHRAAFWLSLKVKWDLFLGQDGARSALFIKLHI